MPTSDAAPTHPRRRFFLRCLVILMTITALNCVFTFALEPYAGSTELMWSEYRSTPEIDFVFVGSSATAFCIAPDVLDDHLGVHSFNMGTPLQTMHDALTSLKCAKRDHDIDRALICIGYETILAYPFVNSSIAYTQAKCEGEDLFQAAQDVCNLLFYPYYFSRLYSLSCLFPWAYEHVELTPEAITANINRRLTMSTIKAAASYAEASHDIGRSYWGQGQVSYTTIMDTSFPHGKRYASQTPDAPIVHETISSFENLCAYAQEAGIDLYVVGAAYAPCVLMEYDQNYVAGMTEIQRLAKNHGATFFDLNMLDKAYFDVSRANFSDPVHLNRSGSEIAAASIAKVIKYIEAGGDLAQISHPYTEQGWQDWLASLDYVDAVDYASMLDGARVLVEAQATTGPNTAVEYRLERQEGEGGAWELVRDWSDDPVFEFQGSADTRVRLQARAVGTQADTREVTGPII